MRGEAEAARAYMGARDVLRENGRAVSNGSVVGAVTVVRKHGLRRLHVGFRVSTDVARTTRSDLSGSMTATHRRSMSAIARQENQRHCGSTKDGAVVLLYSVQRGRWVMRECGMLVTILLAHHPVVQ